MDEAGAARRLHQAGDLDGAERHYMRALAAAPGDQPLRRDLAALLLQRARPREAIPLLREVLSAGARDAQAATMLAFALRGLGDVAAARDAASTALAIEPRDPLALLAAGSLAVIAGDATSAEPWLRAAVAIEPRLFEAWHYLGEALQARCRWQEATAAYRQAMAGHPGEAMNVGICAERAGDLTVARDAYLQAHAAAPGRADVLVRLAQVEAMACRFDDSRAHAAMADALLAAGTIGDDDRPEPFPMSWLETGDVATAQVLERQVRRILARARALPRLPPPTHAVGGGSIRIGYLSADFGRHAVGTLLAGHFAAHDRTRFQVHAYSLRHHDDDVATAIRAGCDSFIDCEAMASDAIARRIRDDGIDVLFDLGGYTAGARPEVLALRPCALQLGWLGFIHGHQAPWLDGIVLDRHVQPVDAAWPWSDAALRLDTLMLPACAMPSGRPDRAGLGLPEGVPLLASFNNSYKLDDALVDAWVRILQRAPRAHLLVYLPEAARSGFLAAWTRHGGDPARLHPCGHLPAERQADRAASCDLFLDAFRYQAGATGIAAAAAGLPLLSRRGDSPLARLGSGLNGFLGMEDLVCTDADAYVARAVALASDPVALAELRARTTAAVARSRLLDPRRAAAAIEDLAVEQLAARRGPHATT
ncbi:O-linked N-acetylglucosamine transferase, SPINDLY family protein [Luteimonas terricola]|uniref:protein O-GlcNAc transferase n=1 Tax=Luteimonas terricola TaxID=645597 RepID=A0ABQ2EK91_9GAMM|nr:tetratricopeptide repeat protein [Luteimonas terricola]GGK12480.1 hypothetical protein GCM10011394_22100 [Luteimonas terricola]